MKQPHSSPSTPRAERGQGLVEFALILPLLLGLLLGIIDFARLFFIYSEVSSGAREAIRFGAVNDNHKQCDQIRQRASSTVTLANINAVNFTVSLDHGDVADTYFTYSADCSGSVPSVAVGDRITVRVQTQVELITANILGSVLRRTFGAMPIDYTTSRTIVPLEGIATGPTSTPRPTHTPQPGSVTDTPTPTPTPTFTPTPPPAPLNFDATVQFSVCPIDNNNPVDFTWITVPGAIGYRIYQDGTNRLIADTSNPPCDNCDNLGTSQFRQYYAVAYNAGGESARSNTDSVSCGAGATDTPTPTPTPTNTPTNTPTPTPSNTPTPSMTLIPSRTPTPSATPCPTTLCTPTPTLNPLTPTPTPADEMLMNFMSGYPAAKTSGPPTTRKFWVKVRLTDTVGNPITDAVVTIVDPAAYFGWSLTHLGSGIYGGNSGASGTCFSGNTTVDILVTVRALKAGYTMVEVSDRTDGRASDVCP